MDKGNSEYIQNETMKRNRILSLTTAWMEMEIIMVSEINQIQKDECHEFLLLCGIFKKFIY
jgi:hypothetical protein